MSNSSSSSKRSAVDWRPYLFAAPTMIAMAVAFLIASSLIGCARPAAQLPAADDSWSLCACRALCGPGAYEWTVTYVGPATPAGKCKCIGKDEATR